MEFYHDPVMKNEVLDSLVVEPGKVIVDCTLGGGGHSNEILNRLNNEGSLIAFDRDKEALGHATKRLEKFENKNLIHSEFSKAADYLDDNSVDGILCDLGISSRHVDNGDRGFSFKNSATVDLRMNNEDPIDGTQWIINTGERELGWALSKNSDLKKQKRIAKALLDLALKYEGSQIPMTSILELVADIFPEKKRDHQSIAIRILQAIRMEVNGELNEIEEIVKASDKILKPGGRIAFLTYHSVEDRLVKRLFKALEERDNVPKNVPVSPDQIVQPLFKRLNKKAQAPTIEEIQKNPRARSAKMRVYVKQ